MPLSAAEFNHVLHELYEQFRQWNDELAMRLEFTASEVVLQDPINGTFTVQGLRISRGDHVLTVEPISCVIVGADARVDLTSGGQRETIIYYQNDGWVHAERHNFRMLATLDNDRFHRVAEVLLR